MAAWWTARALETMSVMCDSMRGAVLVYQERGLRERDQWTRGGERESYSLTADMGPIESSIALWCIGRVVNGGTFAPGDLCGRLVGSLHRA